MDKIDEWMNRAFTNAPDSNQKQNQPGPQQGQGQPLEKGQKPKQFQQKNAQTFRKPQQGQNIQKSQQQPGPKSNQQMQKNQQQKNRVQPQQPQRPRPQGHQGHQGHQGQRGGGHHGRGRGQGTHIPMPTEKSPKAKKAGQFLKNTLKMIPLGGLNEVGKNMMALEFENDIIILDMGLEFPSEDMMGIDYVIPDVSYLEENKKRIRGIVITHGHLDHIGGIPYVLPRLDFPPIYATKLTIGLIKKRIEEFKQDKMAKLITIDPGNPIRLGQFLCNFFRVAHSIPDSCGIIIDTPAGKIVHTGDFKFDETPARNIQIADIATMEALGHQNVLALFCESTNALKPGHSMSEREVGTTLEGIIQKAPGRIIIASFSSQIGRVQQILDAAAKHGRKIYVSGRSMQENIDISAKLGYLSFPKDLIFDIKKYKNKPDEQSLILTTGSQGESVSALTRIASNEHPHVKVKKGDTIVLSSSPIIGNEKAINTVINKLTMLGADVIHNQIMDVHTSGHGKQDELARMVNLIKPQYLVPVHGEYYMRQGLSKIAQERCNIPENRVVMLQNGDVLVAENGLVRKSGETVETKYILIDGLGEGHVGSQVQMDREIMAQNGALVVLVYVDFKTKKLKRDPDVVSRGFIYMHESEEITQEIIKLAADAYRRIQEKNRGANRQDIKRYIRQTVDKFTHTKLERRPLIIPLIIEA